MPSVSDLRGLHHRIVVRAREEQAENAGHGGPLTDVRLAAELAIDVEQLRASLAELDAYLDLQPGADGGWEIRGVTPEVSD